MSEEKKDVQKKIIIWSAGIIVALHLVWTFIPKGTPEKDKKSQPVAVGEEVVLLEDDVLIPEVPAKNPSISLAERFFCTGFSRSTFCSR